MIIKTADSAEMLDLVRKIFCEYQRSIGIDLEFQDFKEELANLPGKYSPPQGRLYIGYIGEKPAGCIALRPMKEKGQCEMKRLFVRPEFRGKNAGKQLAEKIIADAREIGYSQMFLDTLTSMTSARELYTSLGFKPTEPYCYNPFENAEYFRLDL
ncbi:MAG: GNAT family N-acetyltransferase [Firmicutes bacterium]|nr:GNAT family N-acetyltransferase [Bacillota bacterium]